MDIYSFTLTHLWQKMRLMKVLIFLKKITNTDLPNRKLQRILPICSKIVWQAYNAQGKSFTGIIGSYQLPNKITGAKALRIM